jgi:hypothetical protein
MVALRQPIRVESAEVIVDGNRVDNILRALARTNAVGRMTGADGNRQLIVAIQKSGTASATRWRYGGEPWVGSRAVEVAGPLSLYGFELEFGEEVDGRLETPAPRMIERIRTRAECRTRTPQGVMLRWGGADGRTHVRAVVDVSRRGLAFALGANDSVAPGDVLSGVVIDWRGRLRIFARLHIRHVSPRFVDEQAIAGAEVTFDLDEDRDHYVAETDALVDLHTRTGSTWTRDLWELYEKSGYFSLSYKSPADFERLRSAFTTASRKLAAAPALGAQVVWPSARGVEASCAVVALNPHAVFLYHVARRRGVPPTIATARETLHAVYDQALRWVQFNDDVRWLVAWIHDSARFPRRLHLDFVSSYTDERVASVVTFRALEIPANPRDPLASETRQRLGTPTGAPPSRGRPTVRLAGSDDFPQIARAAQTRWPASFLAAYDLFPPFRARWSAWEEASLRRGREIAVAEIDGRLVAAAVIEHGEDGVHLFGLFDLVRIVPIGSPSDEVTTALLQYARAFFARLGKDSFLLAGDPSIPPERWPTGAVDRTLVHCTVMSTSLLPELRAHLWELTIGAHD